MHKKGWSTWPQVLGCCWLLDHVVYLNLRKNLQSLANSQYSCHFVNFLSLENNYFFSAWDKWLDSTANSQKLRTYRPSNSTARPNKQKSRTRNLLTWGEKRYKAWLKETCKNKWKMFWLLLTQLDYNWSKPQKHKYIFSEKSNDVIRWFFPDVSYTTQFYERLAESKSLQENLWKA